MVARGATAVGLCLLILTATDAYGQNLRASVVPHASAVLQNERTLFLECYPPEGTAPADFYGALVPAGEWRKYAGRKGVAIRIEQVLPSVRRQMLLKLFGQDYVDEAGWWHVVRPGDYTNAGFVGLLCKWLTGDASTAVVLKDGKTKLAGGQFEVGGKYLIPRKALLACMREKTGPAELAEPDALEPLGGDGEPGQPQDPELFAGDLAYGRDAQGEYAMYHLKSGEALYSAVVVRFTDFRENADILRACDTIQKRSKIKDVHDMDCGQQILIPLNMLSDRYTPKGSESRRDFEAGIQEARRLRKEQVKSRDLEGVVVVLDPGHGGRDRGAEDPKNGLYEDEINFDVVCRVKKILETQTRAKVYLTLRDAAHPNYEPSDCSRFGTDDAEDILVTPPYRNSDSKVSANLRWFVANDIYKREAASGMDPRKMVFTSFHTDALFNKTMRGAMIYIPGAKYRNGVEEPDNPIYRRFKEVRENGKSESSAVERKRDEGLSRNLAEDVMTALGNYKIRRHLEGDWIRTQIRQDGGKVYLPAVLRNTQIPTKILIEMANMTNAVDRERLADPKWRQSFAEAYVAALKMYFGS